MEETKGTIIVSTGRIGLALSSQSDRGIFIWDIVCEGARNGWHYYNGVIYASAIGIEYTLPRYPPRTIRKWIGIHPWEPICKFEVLRLLEPVRGNSTHAYAVVGDDNVVVHVIAKAISSKTLCELNN